MVQCLSRTLNCYECGYCTINEYKLVLIMNTKKSISYEHIIYIWGYIYIHLYFVKVLFFCWDVNQFLKSNNLSFKIGNISIGTSD